MVSRREAISWSSIKRSLPLAALQSFVETSKVQCFSENSQKPQESNCLAMEECDLLPQIIDFIMGIFFPSKVEGSCGLPDFIFDRSQAPTRTTKTTRLSKNKVVEATLTSRKPQPCTDYRHAVLQYPMPLPCPFSSLL